MDEQAFLSDFFAKMIAVGRSQMENLTIKIYNSGKAKPDQIITIPMSKINIGKQLLPQKAKMILGREGIDIIELSALANKKISKGSLIEIETGTDKITLSVDSE